ncbi:putative lipid-transfer protein DIR1 [Mercurialis annua]|uniref:putative lipid-transfer protein DIR1 n=1 Tax=Mercurialis annua TaxID=3986 RepID=UPI00215FB6A5|nr:putative lipid-transfer protein DIR1 [Mercurialis annua]
MEGVEKHLVRVIIIVAIVGSNGVFQFCNAQSICNMSFSGLLSCRPAVISPNPSPPTSDCCSVLAQGDMNCLCSSGDANLLPAFGIDPNLALQLPDKCNLTHPNC